MKIEPNQHQLKSLDPSLQLLRTPEPPYIAIISTNIHNGKEKEAYDRDMQKTLAIAQDLPGFLGLESGAEVLPDGRLFKLAAVYWKDMASMEHWRTHPDHVAVKREGKRLWYDEHNIRVCQVLKHYGSNLTQGKSQSLANSEGIDEK